MFYKYVHLEKLVVIKTLSQKLILAVKLLFLAICVLTLFRFPLPWARELILLCWGEESFA